MHDVSVIRNLYLCDATGSTHQRGHVSEAQMDSRHDVSHSTTLRSSLGIGATSLQLPISCPVSLPMACGSQQASRWPKRISKPKASGQPGRCANATDPHFPLVLSCCDSVTDLATCTAASCVCVLPSEHLQFVSRRHVLEGSKRWTKSSAQREDRLQISTTHKRMILLLSTTDAARCTLWFPKLLVHALTLHQALYSQPLCFRVRHTL